MNMPIYLGLSILEISKALMHELWYDYVKPKYRQNGKLCYMHTDSFVIQKLKISITILQKTFDTFNYELDILLPIAKNKKVDGLMKDDLGGKFMTDFIACRQNSFSYLMGDVVKIKILNDQKMCNKKKTEDYYEDCNKATQLDNIIKCLEKNGVK